MPCLSVTSATIHGPESIVNPLIKWYNSCKTAQDDTPENERIRELINQHTSKHVNSALNPSETEELISILRFRRAESSRIQHLLAHMGYPPRKPFEQFDRRDVITVKKEYRDIIYLHSDCVHSPLIGRSDGSPVGGPPIGHAGVPIYWAVVNYAAWVAGDWRVDRETFNRKLEEQYKNLLRQWGHDNEGLEAGAHPETLGRFEGAGEFSAGRAASQVVEEFETFFPNNWTEVLPEEWFVGNTTDDYGLPEPYEESSEDASTYDQPDDEKPGKGKEISVED